MSESPPASARTLVLADIRQGESELQLIDSDLSRLAARREATLKRVEAARLYLNFLPPDDAPEDATSKMAAPSESRAAVTPAAKKRKRSEPNPWQSAVHAIVRTAEMGVTFAELRAGLMQTALADKLAQSNKAYHKALSVLDQKKTIVRMYGRVFTPEAHKRFEEALEAGDVSKEAPQPFAHSPMGTAILRLVLARPGITSTQIIVELRKDPEFNASLTPHQTGAFNIIARLARRKQIIRRDDGGLITGPQFPKELLGNSPDEVGAPNGQAAGAPIVGRGATLPFENVVGFPRPR